MQGDIWDVNAHTIAGLTDPEQWDVEFDMDDGSTEEGDFFRDDYVGWKVDGHPSCARWARAESGDPSTVEETQSEGPLANSDVE